MALLSVRAFEEQYRRRSHPPKSLSVTFCLARLRLYEPHFTSLYISLWTSLNYRGGLCPTEHISLWTLLQDGTCAPGCSSLPELDQRGLYGGKVKLSGGVDSTNLSESPTVIPLHCTTIILIPPICTALIPQDWTRMHCGCMRTNLQLAFCTEASHPINFTAMREAQLEQSQVGDTDGTCAMMPPLQQRFLPPKLNIYWCTFDMCTCAHDMWYVHSEDQALPPPPPPAQGSTPQSVYYRPAAAACGICVKTAKNMEMWPTANYGRRKHDLLAEKNVAQIRQHGWLDGGVAKGQAMAEKQVRRWREKWGWREHVALCRSCWDSWSD